MKKHLLSNWINMLGTIIGLYCIILSMALQQLFRNTNERGFTIETVFMETIGGSFIYTYIIFIENLIPFLIYAGLLFLVDYVALQSLKGKENLSKRMNIEIIIFSTLFIGYTIQDKTLGFIIFPLAFIVSQWFRKKKLHCPLPVPSLTKRSDI